MKVHLMYRDRDFDSSQPSPPHEGSLVQDLELSTLFEAMAGQDEWLTKVVAKAVVVGSDDPDIILYRQGILRDCLRNHAVVRQIYDLAVQTIERERKDYFGRSMRSPSLLLHRSVQVLEMLIGALRQLRTIIDGYSGDFRSEGFKTLFSMLQCELDDAYFVTLRQHLKLLQFRHGMLMSAQLGEGNKNINYVLRKSPPPRGNWFTRLFMPASSGYSYTIPDRDESGARALSELRDRGNNLVANALGQSTDHVMSFFNMLRVELAFYIGCLNLNRRLVERNSPVCFPEPAEFEEHHHSADELYDVCLALKVGHKVVGNNLNADGRELVFITGANQGGKSTFLRSIGLAQLMMQCGMFVPAEMFRASICTRIFTHYKREEDAEMNSGKFDEELSRMSQIIDVVRPNSLLLFNESFASTNEREGSEIAQQIVRALVERGMKVFFVTHQYELAHGFQVLNLPSALFLRAERQADGARPFKVVEAEPLETSYGIDLYKQIFSDNRQSGEHAL